MGKNKVFFSSCFSYVTKMMGCLKTCRSCQRFALRTFRSLSVFLYSNSNVHYSPIGNSLNFRSMSAKVTVIWKLN